jgi:predicted nucleic acid-binding Zn ribbon protein
VCSVCGRGFNPGTTVCPDHGEELVPAAAFVSRRAPALVVTRTICPVCGKQYGGDIRFCGECGASVVPIN